jgi:hypothetical protein
LVTLGTLGAAALRTVVAARADVARRVALFRFGVFVAAVAAPLLAGVGSTGTFFLWDGWYFRFVLKFTRFPSLGRSAS